MNNLALVFETNVVSSGNIRILNESLASDRKTKKLVCETILQDFGTTLASVNGNRRLYSPEIGQAIYESMIPNVKKRYVYQEISHPDMNNPDPKINMARAATIKLENCGSVITDLNLRNNILHGTFETLSSFKGPDLRLAITEDKLPIGFSLRMLSKVKPHPNFEGVNEVVGPVKPITYDAVTNPSHKSARITNIHLVNESQLLATLQTEDTNLVLEGMEELFMMENIHYPQQSSQIISEFTTYLMRDAFKRCKPLKFLK